MDEYCSSHSSCGAKFQTAESLVPSWAFSPGADPGIFDWEFKTLVQIIGGYPKSITFLNIPGI